MKFVQHYSGSSGNLYEVVADNGKRLLLDPGVSWVKVQKALNYDLSNIIGCLISHEHKDHCGAIRVIISAGVYVHTSKGTISALRLPQERRIKTISCLKASKIDNFDIYAFNLHHDAKEPLGYVIGCDGEYLLFAPDTSHISQRFNIPFSIIAIECSYDKAILEARVKSEDINEELAKRLLTSHQEKQVAMNYIEKFCNLSKCREIHLLHMSGDNIDKEAARKEFEQKFFVKTIVCQRKTF
jgi:phosphoribosyl 1,2-cyclic phosphodiesterase